VLEVIRFCLVLTVSAVPVALPVVLSVTMALGAVRMARHGAIVSHLTAIEVWTAYLLVLRGYVIENARVGSEFCFLICVAALILICMQQALAGVDILCSDKTGTLTLNELTVQTPWPVQPWDQTDLVKFALLASDYEHDTHDPIGSHASCAQSI